MKFSFLPVWFMFKVSFSNWLLALKQLFGCLQLFIIKQLFAYCLQQHTCVESIIWLFAPCQINLHIGPCSILVIMIIRFLCIFLAFLGLWSSCLDNLMVFQLEYAVMLFWFCFSVAKTKSKNFIFPEFCSFETNSPIDTEFHTLLYLWFIHSEFLWQTVSRRN